MAVFEEVTVNWKGRDYAIPPDQMLRTIARIEDVLTLGQLHGFLSGNRIPFAKISMAFAILLRAAGADVRDDEVYDGMFGAHGADLQKLAVRYVATLNQLMIPPAHLRAEPAKDSATGKRAASSRRRSSS